MPQTPDEIILLTSNGSIADYQGDLLGLYQLMETQHNNAPIYKQLHNVSVHNKVQQHYIYLADGTTSVEDRLRNCNNGSMLPRSGWEYYDGKGHTLDPELNIKTVADVNSLICPSVTITASGEAARLRPKYLGQFKPTSQFSAGRPIFRNSHGKYLLVVPGYTSWGVCEENVKRFQDKKTGRVLVYTNLNSCLIRLSSGSAPDLNPASVRAKNNKRIQQTTWQYRQHFNLNWHDGDIQVSCDGMDAL